MKKNTIVNLLQDYKGLQIHLLNSYFKGMEQAPLYIAHDYNLKYNEAFEVANDHVIKCVKKYANRICESYTKL